MAEETEFAHPPQGHIAPLVYDSVAKKWYAIKGSGYDYLQVDVVASGLPSGAATAAKQLPDGHNVTVGNSYLSVRSGNDKILAIESIVEQELANADLAAGDSIIDGTAVGAGKIWCITLISMKFEGTAPSLLEARLVGLAGNLVPLSETTPVHKQWYVWTGYCYMQTGDYVAYKIEGATLHDKAYLRYAGYQMDAPS